LQEQLKAAETEDETFFNLTLVKVAAVFNQEYRGFGEVETACRRLAVGLSDRTTADFRRQIAFTLQQVASQAEWDSADQVLDTFIA
jgi:predicted secreted protein